MFEAGNNPPLRGIAAPSWKYEIMKQEKIPQEYMTAAKNLVDDKFRVIFGFDGAETVSTNRPGEWALVHLPSHLNLLGNRFRNRS